MAFALLEHAIKRYEYRLEIVVMVGKTLRNPLCLYYLCHFAVRQVRGES